MSKAVLISIRPEWCEKIGSGEKTIEVRKTHPKLATPFKCYIYCTKAADRLLQVMHDGDDNYGTTYHGKPVFIKTSGDTYGWLWHRQQTVIGEFVCDEIIDLWPGYAKGDDCLTYDEQEAYLGECGHGYGWHISDLKIYDQPKELSEFYRPDCERMSDCGCCLKWDRENRACKRPSVLMRAPQSWAYVEELS